MSHGHMATLFHSSSSRFKDGKRTRQSHGAAVLSKALWGDLVGFSQSQTKPCELKQLSMPLKLPFLQVWYTPGISALGTQGQKDRGNIDDATRPCLKNKTIHVFNPSRILSPTQETETGESLWAQGQPGLWSKFQASQSCVVKLYLQHQTKHCFLQGLSWTNKVTPLGTRKERAGQERPLQLRVQNTTGGVDMIFRMWGRNKGAPKALAGLSMTNVALAGLTLLHPPSPLNH